MHGRDEKCIGKFSQRTWREDRRPKHRR